LRFTHSRQDNDDVLRRIRKPVLLTHGIDDAAVRPAVVDRHKAMVTHAQVDLMPKAGHAPFWDDAAAFNRRLRQFAQGL
jgi:pimeloyl-ACP methyl ester carboxylesterase